MASKQFAHWNGFPFMTAPRTRYYSAQLQSAFFRLPREIRDAVYDYYLAGLLQHDDFVNIYTQYPSVKVWFNTPLRQSVVERVDKLANSESWVDDIARQAFSNALQHALLLAKSQNPTEFAKLACEVFGTRQCPIPVYDNLGSEINFFIEEALYGIFSWHPAPWSMPKDDEVKNLEALICRPEHTDDGLPIKDESDRCFRNIALHIKAAKERWFFSAASIAIDFLQRLPVERRHNMRKMVLYEDFKAVCRPECHARGLIPFCLENLELRIERHISLFGNLLPEGFYSRNTVRHDSAWLLSSVCFCVIIPWFEEALCLSIHGMPTGSFTLVLDGTTRESFEIWKLLKYAAATQEARMRQLQLTGASPPIRYLPPSYRDCWDLPISFADTIRDIVEGNSIIKFDGDVCDVWDSESFFFERKDWTNDKWYKDWVESVLHYGIGTTFFQRESRRYYIQPVALRTTYTVVRNKRRATRSPDLSG
ncbi:hypothetical protein Alg215_02721 [Pyrenophora tritici-repentis]|nr:hypothetical protein Alg215_02721 [Pyrenophora tritici-repentis]